MARNEVSLAMNDECVDKETDILGLGCSRQSFTEHNEVENLIEDLPSLSKDFRAVERSWQRFSFILDQYQEQPNLIDSNLDNILFKIITIIRNKDLDEDTKHLAFRYMYFIAKVRGYKVVARHLPHEISDLEPTLEFLEKQDPNDITKWETHYSLLLWFGIIVKIPFHLGRFHSTTSIPVMDRILNVCKNFLSASTAAQDMACYLASIYITRPDVRELYLPGFCDWTQEVLKSGNVHFKKGVLVALAGVFKHGQRQHLMTIASKVLQFTLANKFQSCELPIVKKPLVKLIQRIGLIFLKPRLASWRYQRGSRSLAANLNKAVGVQVAKKSNESQISEEENEDEDVPEEIEEVLEEILQGLRDKIRDVQYSAAKGIGRLTNRLPKNFADQVVESILELFSLKESDMAWHGGCLAMAELARRGLLLPQRLPQVLPLIEQALIYDELRGNFSVGSAVRDAACYVCWAFARAYDPALLQSYVKQLARSLLITTVFDREVNCRRAAASAFQEHVGRQGTFPHGIDILTTCDYFAVGMRRNTYLNLSIFIAQYVEYRQSLIDHLIERKIMHWDTAVRYLTSQTLYKLTFLDPTYMRDVILSKLLRDCYHPDLHLRHGSVLASGEMINALCKVAEEQHSNFTEFIGEDKMTLIIEISNKIIDDRYLRSFGGDQMRQAVAKFVENCSKGHVAIPTLVRNNWLRVLRESLASVDSAVQQTAVHATASLIDEYYKQEEKNVQSELLHSLVSELNSNNQHSRMGHALLFGSIPKFMLVDHLPTVVTSLSKCSEITSATTQWAESRKNSLWGLAQIVVNVGISTSNSGIDGNLLDIIFLSMLNGMEDYTVDSRGDIGAIVRESAMSSLQTILEVVCKSDTSYLNPSLVQSILCGLVKQATEQIRRTRLLAASVFCTLIYCDPPLPYVSEKEALQSIIPPPPLDISTEKECYDLWIQLIHFESYRKSVLTGFVASIGSLTESLVKSSSAPLFAHLRCLNAHNQIDELRVVAEDILDIFRSNVNNARFMPYMFCFLDHVLSSGCFDDILNIISQPLFSLIRTEMSSGSKPLKLLLSSIELYCHLLRGDDETFKKCVSLLLTLLVNRFPRVRKITAAKLYEALLTLTDMNEELCNNQDEILSLLSDTDWDEDVAQLKPIKNQLSHLFHLTA